MLKNLRRKFQRFLYRNSGRGVPNLMLYVGIGNLIVFVMSLVDPSNVLYQVLRFDRADILSGQVWRLFTYIFTYLLDAQGINLLLSALMLFCYYWMGRTLEQHWGTLRFNLYYLSGIVLMDVAALLIGLNADTYYLNLSLFLAIATIMPDAKFLLFYIIPVKAKYLAWVDFVLTLFPVITGVLSCITAGASIRYYFYYLYPLIAILNYFLFFGKDIKNVLPDFMVYRRTKTQRSYQNFKNTEKANAYWADKYHDKDGQQVYHHKCCVCGRTDTEFPQLEFRYCSKCSGYRCYCQDHINNHAHIQD